MNLTLRLLVFRPTVTVIYVYMVENRNVNVYLALLAATPIKKVYLFHYEYSSCFTCNK